MDFDIYYQVDTAFKKSFPNFAAGWEGQGRTVMNFHEKFFKGKEILKLYCQSLYLNLR